MKPWHIVELLDYLAVSTRCGLMLADWRALNADEKAAVIAWCTERAAEQRK